MDIFITTVLNRPYVFAFLIAYLFLSIKRWGLKRSILWLVSGYLIAWLSEYSSIHNGFPYGEYHYIYENLQGELLIGGVPFFDSLSYPFLIFAGYTTAEFILPPLPNPPPRGGREWVGVIVLGALLTMFLDVIIDPIATMGDKWFLGKIHYYAHPGWYFGVPLTNFGGWFLVPLIVIVFNILIWKLNPPQPPFGKGGQGGFDIIYPLFYLSIALFNIAVTFWIGEAILGIASSTILFAISIIIVRA